MYWFKYIPHLSIHFMQSNPNSICSDLGFNVLLQILDQTVWITISGFHAQLVLGSFVLFSGLPGGTSPKLDCTVWFPASLFCVLECIYCWNLWLHCCNSGMYCLNSWLFYWNSGMYILSEFKIALLEVAFRSPCCLWI